MEVIVKTVLFYSNTCSIKTRIHFAFNTNQPFRLYPICSAYVTPTNPPSNKKKKEKKVPLHH